MKSILFFISVTIFNFTNAQVSTKTFKIIKPLEKYKSFYALNEEPEKIEKELYDYATNDELFYLSNNGASPYVKATAVKVLSKKNDNRLSQIFKKSINATETILYTTECLSSEQLLSSYFFDTAARQDRLSAGDREKLKKEMLDWVLNSNPVNTKLLEEIKYQIPVSGDTYLKLRNQVLETKSPELLIALAKYKNPNDIELIKSFGEEAFLAIEEFPDEKFLSFLDSNIEHSVRFPFMFALSSFCSEEAKKIVDKVIEFKKMDNKKNDCGNICLSIIYQQIDKNKCKVFYPSLENLWLTDKIISFDMIENYEKTHTKKETEDFIMKGFLQEGEPEIIASNMYDLDHAMDHLTSDLTYDGNLRLVKLLNKVKGFSEESYNAAVRNALQYVDDLDSDILIKRLNDNEVVLKNKDILLERLRTNKSAYGLLIMMDGIKRLSDKALFEEGAKIVILRKKEFLPKWEKFYKEFIRNNHLIDN